MKEYDAYLFDADGTLIDSKEIIQQSFNHAIERLGATHPGRDFIGATIGLPVMAQMRMVMGEGREDAYYEEARRVYGDFMTEHFQDYLGAFPGVKEGLEVLRARGKKLAVVTSRRRASLERFLDYLGLGACFDLLVTPESTERHKPEAEPALFAARAFGAEPARCVFIGDAVFDIQCGNAAGMDTVLVSWGGLDPVGWPVQPDLIVDDFAALLPD